MKRVILISMVLLCHVLTGKTQTLSGVMNHYLQVQSVSVPDLVYYIASDEDTAFHPGDKVLIIQMTGTFFTGVEYSEADYGAAPSGHKNCGVFEILQIEEVNQGAHYIRFTSNLSRTYDNDEKIQLVKLIEERKATIGSGNLYAAEWNGNTGGVVGMIIYDTLRLNGNIIADGRGFRGASVTETNYTGDCGPLTGDSINFLPSHLNRAGNKGEGTVTKSFAFTKGVFFAANGGGGGNRKFAGGGGGGNYREGGVGGRQDTTCTGTYMVAKGGIENMFFYESQKRIVFGGGGGSGVSSSSTVATKGGDGGGIVILVAGVVEPNNHSILANGENVIGNATASAGGGGAGGVVLIDVNSYSGSFNTVATKGGNGGNVTGNSGSGGGGAGGVIKYSGPALPASVINIGRGSPGYAPGTTQGFYGVDGKVFSSFNIEFNGFLFNVISGADTICEGQQPGMLTGTTPKGGTGIYSFQWQQSTDQVSWVNAAGTGPTAKDFLPDVLSQTNFFRRIVTSGTIKDTSKTIQILVYENIQNNLISGSDSLCQGIIPLILSGELPSGGSGTYYYQWQKRTESSSWSDILNGTDQDYSPSALNETSLFRRFVTSHTCLSYSDSVKLQVFDPVTGNDFETDHVRICSGNDPGVLLPSSPGEGFGSYTYQWQEYSNQSWSDLNGETAASYSPGMLTDSAVFRRIVFSDSTPLGCSDISDEFYVNVLPSLENNSITGGGVQYTCFGTRKSLSGTAPSGGAPEDYAFFWQSSIDYNSWTDTGEEINILSSPLTDSAWFRRIVISPASGGECIDTSESVKILINPLPSAAVISAKDTICEGQSISIGFTVSGGYGPWDITLGEGNITKSVEDFSENSGSVSFTLSDDIDIRVLSVRDDSLCVSENGDGVAEIKVYPFPEADAGEDAEVCGLNYTLEAEQTSMTGLWSAEGVIFDNPDHPDATVTAADYGTQELIWTASNWNCSSSDQVNVTFYEKPLSVDAGEDQILNFRFYTTLSAISPVTGTGMWTVSEGTGTFDDASYSGTGVTLASQKNVLKWTVSNGVCTPVSDSITVSVNLLEIPKGFFPDGDQNHFKIEIERAEKTGLIIFNRFGQTVFEADDYSPENYWDGTLNGSALPEGTYFYILKVKIRDIPDAFEFKSYVELIREK